MTRSLSPLVIWFSATVLALAQPTITLQPASLSLSIGATATFRVTATTTNGPITYQWRHQEVLLDWATNASLTLTNVHMADTGPYIIAVTDAGGTTNSAAAILDVDPTFTKITSDPIVTGQGYDFSVGYWADYDNDGDVDLFVVTDRAGYNPIYRNNGDGTFTQIFEPSLQAVRAVDWVYSWGDYDNDGYLDFFVPEGLMFSNNLLYHNNADGTFTRITNSPIASEGFRSSAGTWADYDRDGDLDLYVANGSAGPDIFSTNWFYQNQGDGTFIKLTNGLVRPLISEGGYYDLPVWVDIDNDGWQDLFLVKTGSSSNFLYRNNGGGGFVKVTDDPLVQELDSHWGDAAWADYDNDGDLDVFLTTRHLDPSDTGPVALFRNDGRGHFTKMTTNEVGSLAGARAITYVCCWGDYDNDGWLDLYIANAWYGGESRTDLLYHNNGDGTFAKVTTGSPVTELGAAFGGFLVDVNNDGFLDLFTAKHPAPDNSLSRLYLNNGNSNQWLGVKCVGTVSPRFGTGTKVRVKATIRGQSMWQLRVIDPGGFANAQNFIAHFGLGDATNVETLHLEWTSGIVQELHDIRAKQYLTMTEPVLPIAVLPALPDVSLGANVTLSLNTNSSLPWTCQWRLNDFDLAGETNLTLHLASAQTNQAGSYSAFVSDGTNWVTTRPAILRVFDRPLITAQPTDQFVRPGSNVTFSVSAYSPVPMTYQWQANGTNIADATNATLTLTNVQLADEGVYTVVVTDTADSVISAPANLWILINPVILQPPLSQAVVEGGDVTLSTVISGNPPPFLFQWRRGFTVLTNIVQQERTCFFTLTNVRINQGGLYRLYITNAASPNWTAVNTNFNLTVLADTDADGLPDVWETECGLDPASPNHAAADDDGDGQCNGAEYVAGTDPTNAVSYLKVDAITLENGGSATGLRFLAVSNKTYTVQYRESLANGEWSRLADVVAAPTNRVVEISDPGVRTAGRRFYRLVTPHVP